MNSCLRDTELVSAQIPGESRQWEWIEPLQPQNLCSEMGGGRRHHAQSRNERKSLFIASAWTLLLVELKAAGISHPAGILWESSLWN